MSVRMTLEADGKHLRGIAVPYGEPALVWTRGPSGEEALVEEVFDVESIPRPPKNIPLLVGHDRSAPPAGIITGSRVEADGLTIEATVTGSADEKSGWRERWTHGLMTALSVGFSPGRGDVWTRPEQRGDLPRVVRRGVTVHEISLVNWPAFAGARLTALTQRSVAMSYAVDVGREALHATLAVDQAKHAEATVEYAALIGRGAALGLPRAELDLMLRAGGIDSIRERVERIEADRRSERAFQSWRARQGLA